jgi:hypothetical protein
MNPVALKALIVALTALAVCLRRRADGRLPWTALWALAAVFTSRVYWLTPWATLRLEQLACLALFLHFLVDLRRRGRLPSWRALPLLLPAMLPFMILASWLASPLPAASLRKTLIYFPYLGGFIALVHFIDGRERLAAAWDFLVRFGSAMLALSLAGYFLFFAGVDLGMVRVEYGALWLRGTLVSPNILGAAAGIVLIATLVRVLATAGATRRARLLDWGGLAVAAAALLASFSRAALALSLLAAAAAFLLLRAGGRRVRLAAILAILLPGLITAAVILAGSRAIAAERALHPQQAPAAAGEFGEAALDRYWNSKRHASAPVGRPFRERFQRSQDTVHWRLWAVSEALKDWRRSPLTGRGTDSLPLAHPDVRKYYIPVSAVAILHDWGVAAFLLYAAFMLLAFLGLWRRAWPPGAARGLELALLLAFVFHAAQSQITTTMQLGSFWILAALFAAAAGTAAGPGSAPERAGARD